MTNDNQATFTPIPHLREWLYNYPTEKIIIFCYDSAEFLGFYRSLKKGAIENRYDFVDKLVVFATETPERLHELIQWAKKYGYREQGKMNLKGLFLYFSVAILLVTIIVGVWSCTSQTPPPTDSCSVTVQDFTFSPKAVKVNETVQVTVNIDNPKGLGVKYNWSVTDGKVNPELNAIQPNTTYTAPDYPGNQTITVKVLPIECQTIERSIQIVVGAGNTPTPTPSSTPTPTNTLVIQSSPTPLATPTNITIDTSTPIPPDSPVTPSPTAPTSAPSTPTVIPSATTVASSPTPTTPIPSSTPTIMALATPTPISLPVTSTNTITLIAPEANATVTSCWQEFQWSYDATLAPNQAFEIRIWKGDGSHDGAYDATATTKTPSSNGIYSQFFNVTSANSVKKNGNSPDYFWSVAIVEIEPDYKGDIGIEATPRALTIDCSTGPGGGGGGDPLNISKDPPQPESN